MNEDELDIKNLCIEKAEYLNTCNNYVGEQKTSYLLDCDEKETGKLIEWSHLYAIMAFHNMIDNSKINNDLLNEVAQEFESTFKYEEVTIKTEIITNGDDNTENSVVQEKKTYILVESDTIFGHYIYKYEDQVTKDDNVQTTSKVLVSETLVSEEYERLRDYLKNKLHISNDELDTDVQIVIQAASGYDFETENIEWLKNNSSVSSNTNETSLVSIGMFIWPIPGYTTITSHFGMRTHPITRSL